MNHHQQIRYSRNIALPEISETGQKKLIDSKVLVIGAGGLGSPLLMYLAAAGVGTIGVVDNDQVELCNLQRQIIHGMWDVEHPKTDSVSDSIRDLNPDIQVVCHQLRVDASNVDSVIADYDIVADGSDNFVTRLLINDACVKAKKTLVSAAVQGFSGQLSTFKAYLGASHPCYRCLYPDIPLSKTAAPSCSESGVLGSVAGIMGTWQATEVMKELLGLGTGMSGLLVMFDALAIEVRKIKITKDVQCVCCGNV